MQRIKGRVRQNVTSKLDVLLLTLPIFAPPMNVAETYCFFRFMVLPHGCGPSAGQYAE